MVTGRFKVFDHCSAWYEEFRQYHRKDGRIVKAHDDLLDATLYFSRFVGPRCTMVLPGKSRGTFDNVILSGGPYDPICTTTIYG